MAEDDAFDEESENSEGNDEEFLEDYFDCLGSLVEDC